jgi:fatty acid/phospholipid biosynthesis enzyme
MTRLGIAATLAFVGLAACEKDADKVVRLQQENSLARLEVQMYQKRADSLLGVAAMLNPDAYPSHRLRNDSAHAAFDVVQRDKADAMLRAGRTESELRKLLGS